MSFAWKESVGSDRAHFLFLSLAKQNDWCSEGSLDCGNDISVVCLVHLEQN